jgi:hypothetical protein
MLYLKSKLLLLLAFLLFCAVSYSQNMIMGAGTLIATIDGKVDTISLNISSHNEPNTVYCDAMGGTAEIGLFHFMWEKAGTFADIKPYTLDLKTPEAPGLVQWADFLTTTPYSYKSGKFSVTGNDGKTLTGTYEAVALLGGSDILGGLLKGKKETVLTGGTFVINYAK